METLLSLILVVPLVVFAVVVFAKGVVDQVRENRRRRRIQESRAAAFARSRGWL